MNKQFSDNEKLLLIEEQASLWILKLEEDPSASMRVEFERWLKIDDMHQLIYQEMYDAWDLSSQLCTEDILADSETLPTNKSTSLLKSLSSLLDTTIMRPIGLSFGVLCVVAFSYVASYDSTMAVSDTEVSVIDDSNKQIHRTEIGQSNSFTLPDGTMVHLAANSQINVNFSPVTRNIELVKGEALFSVFKDKSRPFIVSNNGRIAQAIGTLYNVKESYDGLQVVVLEGVVKVESTINSLLPSKLLTAGQGIQVSVSGSMSEVFEHTNDEMMDWQKGRLTYVNVPLASVIYDIERFVNVRIYVKDKNVEEMRYTGNLQLNSVEQWLQELPKIFPLTLQQYGDTSVLSKRE